MIDKNVTLRTKNDKMVLYISGPEIEDLGKKWKGNVHIKVSKPMSPKTLAQLAAFHPLSMALYLSRMHSAPPQFCASYSLFREWLKMEFGVVTALVEYHGSTIPICKSMAEYTINEMTQILQGLIVVCHETKAYPENSIVVEIINGIEENKKTA